MLSDGFHNVPPGRLATVVTHLEMREPVPQRSVPHPDGLNLRLVDRPDPDWYRDLFTRVGGHDWLWFSRLQMSAAELDATLSDDAVDVYALERDGHAEGLLELDFREPQECELAFFGVTTALIGSGVGRYLMNQAVERAWSRPITRFHVHTCTLDHPAALGFYRRSGFVPLRQQIEIAPDPRLNGLMPDTAGVHVPMFREDPA